jgi:uncharacterized protein (DUF488 family)
VDKKAMTLFTVGHSTHSTEQFLTLLTKHAIKALADVRRFPGSRKHPQFGRAVLADSLRESGIEYHWFEALGGRRSRSPTASADNLGLRNESFRNYADYMLTTQFHAAVEELLRVAVVKPTAIMCSEGLFWRCHRRLISDFLLMKGISVQHIMPAGDSRPHTLTSGARIEGGVLTYPSSETEQTKPLFD